MTGDDIKAARKRLGFTDLCKECAIAAIDGAANALRTCRGEVANG